jgi:8-oxo-dGTP pyrophosphatase MutT (NUDIX family)
VFFELYYFLSDLFRKFIAVLMEYTELCIDDLWIDDVKKDLVAIGIETSSYVFGEAVVPSQNDFFVCAIDLNTCDDDGLSMIYDSTLRENETVDEALRVHFLNYELGRVVDFGSGTRRHHCDYLNVIEHVEWKLQPEKCKCGCGIVPYLTPFYHHDRIQTFVAINSIQNNSEVYQNRLFSQLIFYQMDFMIVVPKKLHSDEFDPSHLLLTMFPAVQTGDVEGHRAMKYFYYQFGNYAKVLTSIVDYPKVEVNITPRGDPTFSREPGFTQSVLVFAIDENLDLQVVSKDDGPVDFIVAGHIQYGERPLETAEREWREEMVSPVPKLLYYGRVDPPLGRSQAYVFCTQVVSTNLVCDPERGRVRVLRSDDFVRDDMLPSLFALKSFFKFPKLDIDALRNINYRKRAKGVVIKEMFRKPGEESGSKKPLRRPKTRKKGVKQANWHNDPVVAKEMRARVEAYVRMKKTQISVLMSPSRVDIDIAAPIAVGSCINVRHDFPILPDYVNLVSGGRQVGTARLYDRNSREATIYVVKSCVESFPEMSTQKCNVVHHNHLAVTDNELGVYLLMLHLRVNREEAHIMLRVNKALVHFISDNSDGNFDQREVKTWRDFPRCALTQEERSVDSCGKDTKTWEKFVGR